MKRILAAALIVLATLPAHAQLASEDGSEVASLTFVKACIAYMGAYGELREQLRPDRDLYLPQLSAADARPFLNGHEGEVHVRPDVNVALALIKDDDSCTVFMQRGNPDKLYQHLLRDLKAGLNKSFAVAAAGQASKGPLVERYIDLAAIGEYKADWTKLHGAEPPVLRVTMASAGAASPNLKAIVTLGTKP